MEKNILPFFSWDPRGVSESFIINKNCKMSSTFSNIEFHRRQESFPRQQAQMSIRWRNSQPIRKQNWRLSTNQKGHNFFTECSIVKLITRDELASEHHWQSRLRREVSEVRAEREMSPLADSGQTLFVVLHTVDSQLVSQLFWEHVATLSCTAMYVGLYSTYCVHHHVLIVQSPHSVSLYTFINIHF